MSYLDTSIYYVYQLRLETSDLPFYIGKGQKSRPNRHFANYILSDKSHKSNTILKAKKEGISVLVEKLHKNLTEDEAFSLEIWYIYKYGRRDIGTGILTNRTYGGEGAVGAVRSIENKSQMISRIANYFNTRTQEEKERVSKRLSDARKSLDLQPWEHPNQKPENLIVWSRAIEVYNLFKMGYNTKNKLAKQLEITPNKLAKITKRISCGWNPNLDQQWLNRFG